MSNVASVLKTPEQSMSIVFLLIMRISAPICFKILRSIVTSEICGMFSMRQTPSTINAAGIIATAAFFAPLISISP